MKTLRYAIVIEVGEPNCSAYVPDLPGCVSISGKPSNCIGKVCAKTASRFPNPAPCSTTSMSHDSRTAAAPARVQAIECAAISLPRKQVKATIPGTRLPLLPEFGPRQTSAAFIGSAEWLAPVNKHQPGRQQ